ncbi:hypothetical protein [Stenotrophomonas maltophilia]|uniref:hypothetical protein n=1 Tax=Stenotrophomonas maltophilia TaxID=40324 RepID=UPI0013DB27C2|nr:hypothetical protein [Stenotrophomonas maltophilia]
MTARRLIVRTAIAISVSAVVAAGVPAAYHHARLAKAIELIDWNQQIVNNDASPPQLVQESVSLISEAGIDANRHRYDRDFFIQIALGVPLIAWVTAGAVLWVTKREEGNAAEEGTRRTKDHSRSA